MSTIAVGAPSPAAIRRIRRAWAISTARHPEWWALALAAAAWMIAAVGQPAMDSVHHAHGAHHEHLPAANWYLRGWCLAFGAWLVMTVAMMVPVSVPRIRRVAAGCLGPIRNRAIAETLLGSLALWAAVGTGVAAATAAGVMVHPGDHPAGYLGAWAGVAAWQFTTPKRRALRTCHGVAVPPGREHGTERVVAGWSHARRCAIACGPAMVVMAATGHDLAMAAALTIGFTGELVADRPERIARLTAAAIVGIAATTIVLEGLTPWI